MLRSNRCHQVRRASATSGVFFSSSWSVLVGFKVSKISSALCAPSNVGQLTSSKTPLDWRSNSGLGTSKSQSSGGSAADNRCVLATMSLSINGRRTGSANVVVMLLCYVAVGSYRCVEEI